MKWLLALLCAVACSRAPQTVRPVAADFQEVAYPPPPAQVEEVSEELPGRPECSWLDGHYEWRGRKWIWLPGEWIVAPEDCTYAPGLVQWGSGANARLYYTPPRWYRADGKTPCSAPASCR